MKERKKKQQPRHNQIQSSLFCMKIEWNLILRIKCTQNKKFAIISLYSIFVMQMHSKFQTFDRFKKKKNKDK